MSFVVSFFAKRLLLLFFFYFDIILYFDSEVSSSPPLGAYIRSQTKNSLLTHFPPLSAATSFVR